MSLPFRLSLILLVILAGFLLTWGAVKAAAGMQAGLPQVTPTPLPEKPAVELPNISFIESPTASCELSRRNTGSCTITWSYLYAYADPNYMITMTVDIDDHARARFQGFFQTYMFVPTEFLYFDVPCGAPGSGGDPLLGMTHSYTIRARDSAGLKSSNYGSVTCPADQPHIYLPLLRK